VFKNPLFLLSNEPLNEVNDLKPILENAKNQKQPIVIIAPYYSDEVSAFFVSLLNNKVQELSFV